MMITGQFDRGFFAVPFLFVIVLLNSNFCFCYQNNGTDCAIPKLPRQYQSGWKIKEANCSVKHGRKRADCLRVTNWTSIRVLSSDIEELQISSSYLYRIPNRIFSHLPKLQTLRLEYSAIICANECAFCGLPKLKHLSLSRNLIRPSDYASITTSLRGLNLSYLYLDDQKPLDPNSPPKLTSEALEAFSSLSIDFLSLQQNRYTIVDYADLKSLNNIQCVSLARNSLTITPAQATYFQMVLGLRKMTSLKMFDISDQIVTPQSYYLRGYRSRRYKDCMDAISEYESNTCKPDPIDTRQLATGTQTFNFLPPKLTRFYIGQKYSDPMGPASAKSKNQSIVVIGSIVKVVDVTNYPNSNWCSLPNGIQGLECAVEFVSTHCVDIEATEESFLHFDQLKLIDWSYGRFNSSMMTRNIFRQNANLRSLILQNCGLTCADINRKDSFLRSSSLENLNIAGNPLSCFPTALLETLPQLRVLNISGHSTVWFDERAMTFIDQLVDTNMKASTSLLIDVNGNFQCTCDRNSLSFVSWFQKRMHIFHNGNQTTCVMQDASTVLIKDVDLQSLKDLCPSEGERSKIGGLNFTTYIFIFVVTLFGLVFLTGLIVYTKRKVQTAWKLRRQSQFQRVSEDMPAGQSY